MMSMSLFSDIVREHHTDSDGVLVAAREPCISIAFDEQTNVPGRSFQMIHPDELDELELRESWKMAVLLCPGDDAGPIADWIDETGRDPKRVVFYLHEETSRRDALEPWDQAGLPIHAWWEISSWKELHKHFGAAWNNQVFDDFKDQ